MKIKNGYKCSCGEEFNFDGWNIKKINTQGNNYQYEKGHKYTICNKCKKKIILK
jgi:DNA-directed RNA polymerase subunit RPC12/RpoP